jgi:hypothetical protein
MDLMFSLKVDDDGRPLTNSWGTPLCKFMSFSFSLEFDLEEVFCELGFVLLGKEEKG